MNVFEKLNEARVRFQMANVKKSGNNKFAGYTYYELADILPQINAIAKDLKFSCVVCFTADIATLDFIDIEKPEDKINSLRRGLYAENKDKINAQKRAAYALRVEREKTQ